MMGHLCCDLNQGALPAILAYFYVTGKLSSLESVAWFVFASNMISSVAQPLVGIMSDRAPRPWLMPFGIAMAAVGISMLGFIDDYSMMLGCALFSGLGIAIFHPAGGKTAHASVTEGRLGRGMSIFYVGGNLGFAAGPVYATVALTLFGEKGTLMMLLPAFICICALVYMNPKFANSISKETRRQALNRKADGVGQDRYGAFSILTVVIFCRSILFFALNTFIPLFWVKILNESVDAGNLVLSVIAVIGAISTFFGGVMSDRFGANNILKIMCTIICPLMILFTSIQCTPVNTIVIAALAFCLYAASSTITVLGQKFLCNHTGFAAGVTIGLAMSFGGIGAPILGYIGDAYGLLATFWILAFLSAAAMIVSYAVPSADQKKNVTEENC